MPRFRRLTDTSESRWAYFLPPAPTSVTAASGNAQAVVSWTAPTVLAQTPITDYVVQYSSNSGSTWTTFSDGTSTTTSATVTGLTNGTAYTFRVAAVNGVGAGVYSTASGAVTPGGDPYFSNVSLLLKFEGSDATDSSTYEHTITTSGGASVTDTQAMFGQKSLNLFGGGGDYTNSRNIYTPTSSAFAFGVDPFVIECWFWPTFAFDGKLFGLSTQVAGSSGPPLNVLIEQGSGLTLYFTGGNSASLGTGYAASQWHHIAIARSVGTMRVYVNGTRKFITDPGWGGDVGYGGNFSGARRFCIGGSDPDYWNNFKGYVDEVRVTKGFDRGYTGETITVPTAAFTDS